jgi:protein SPT2
VPLPSPVQKRKAGTDLQRTTDKLVRRDQPDANSTATMTQIKKPANSLPAAANSRPTVAASSNVRVNPTSNGTGVVMASATEPVKPPKKGSYAEILARAKAAQATLGKVGRIQHKAIEKGLSKRERQELKERGLQSHRVSKRPSQSGVRKNVQDGRNGAREKSGKISSRMKVPVGPEKKIKKAALATTGYTGTARPNPGAVKSSKSTMPSRANEKTSFGRSSSGRRNTYASEDEDEDEEDEDGQEEDYDSDASSNMEADVFEVDEEEERAARIARKEDEEALREEARHQREKEEKRRRLADMAKSRR